MMVIDVINCYIQKSIIISINEFVLYFFSTLYIRIEVRFYIQEIIMSDQKRKARSEALNVMATKKMKLREDLLKPLDGVEKVVPIKTDEEYDVIMMDPPWNYKFGRGWCTVPYPSLKQDELKKIALPSKKSALLFIWVTPSMVKDAIDLFAAYGFRYTGFWATWIKTTKGEMIKDEDGSIIRETHARLGIGYYSHGNAEFILFGVKGQGMTKLLEKGKRAFSSIFFSDRPQLHSRKPPEFMNRIRHMFGSNVDNMNFLEIFCRWPTVPGWDGWGLETPGFPCVKKADNLEIQEITTQSFILKDAKSD